MAWNFAASQNVSMADDAALTLPNGAWTMAGWIHGDGTNTGTSVRMFIAWNGTTNPSSISIGATEATYATYPARFYQRGFDDGGTLSYQFSNASLYDSSIWMHVAVIRQASIDNRVRLFVNGLDVANFEDVQSAAINPAQPLIFGSTWVGGQMAEWAKWDRDLSISGDLTALANGYCPGFIQNELTWWVPMLDLTTEKVNGLALTNTNATLTSHPRIIYPSRFFTGHYATASGVSIIPRIMYSYRQRRVT